MDWPTAAIALGVIGGVITIARQAIGSQPKTNKAGQETTTFKAMSGDKANQGKDGRDLPCSEHNAKISVVQEKIENHKADTNRRLESIEKTQEKLLDSLTALHKRIDTVLFCLVKEDDFKHG